MNIMNFKQFESKYESLSDIESNPEFDKIMEDIRIYFKPWFIDEYITYNFDDYCDQFDMEEEGYDDMVKYYKNEGGGNGIEYDLIQQMWDYIKEKYNIDLSDVKYINLKYSLDYYIKENFPYFQIKDYRLETSYDRLLKHLNGGLDQTKDGIKL